MPGIITILPKKVLSQ